jgi:methylated-DNA-[protein]-cysteine S-methyltransferase
MAAINAASTSNALPGPGRRLPCLSVPMRESPPRLDFAFEQEKVWTAMIGIPFGQTRSYGQLARQVGNVNAMRAVGAANGKNPIAIIGPCHRVIGSNGKLTGYAGGLAVKEYLLALESGQVATLASLKTHRQLSSI